MLELVIRLTVGAAAWSPNSRTVFFDGGAGATTQLFALDVATGATRQLTNVKGVLPAFDVAGPIGIRPVWRGHRRIVLLDAAAHLLEQFFLQRRGRHLKHGAGVGVLGFEVLADERHLCPPLAGVDAHRGLDRLGARLRVVGADGCVHLQALRLHRPRAGVADPAAADFFGANLEGDDGPLHGGRRSEIQLGIIAKHILRLPGA